MKYNLYAKKTCEKIKKYGSECVIERIKESFYDKSTNTYEDKKEILNGYAIQLVLDTNSIDGKNIKIGDISLMCSFLDGVPTVNDTIFFAEKKYSIISAEPVSPNGKEVIYYEVYAR